MNQVCGIALIADMVKNQNTLLSTVFNGALGGLVIWVRRLPHSDRPAAPPAALPAAPPAASCTLSESLRYAFTGLLMWSGRLAEDGGAYLLVCIAGNVDWQQRHKCHMFWCACGLWIFNEFSIYFQLNAHLRLLPPLEGFAWSHCAANI